MFIHSSKNMLKAVPRTMWANPCLWIIYHSYTSGHYMQVLSGNELLSSLLWAGLVPVTSNTTVLSSEVDVLYCETIVRKTIQVKSVTRWEGSPNERPPSEFYVYFLQFCSSFNIISWDRQPKYVLKTNSTCILHARVVQLPLSFTH